MKTILKIAISFTLLSSLCFAADNSNGKKIVLGFAQIGAESDWRIANTKSIKNAAKEAGIILRFADAQQRQENQIKAIKTFIAQKVDIIAFSPVVVTGWDDVLKAAKEAKIPVILLDRGIDSKDESLWTAFIGSDFFEEGKRAANCMMESVRDHNWKDGINIVELQGTIGSAPTIQRKQGFEEVLRKHPNYKIIKSQAGDFRRSLGKEIMELFLKDEKRKTQVLYAHNDDMAIGAIQAISETGLKPGKDIIIVSVDGIKDALTAIKEGKLNCSVECTPLLGPLLMKAVKDIASGKTVPKKIVSKEHVFTPKTLPKDFANREY